MTYGDDGDESLTVTNVYAITTAQPKVEKKIEGNTTAPSYKDETFTFTLTPVTPGEEDAFHAPVEGVTAETVTVTGAGMVTFSEVTYTEEGEYHYILKETKGEANGWTYDVNDDGEAIEHTVIVMVEANDDDELEATITYDGKASLTVTNTFETGELTVTKAVTAYNVQGEVYSSAKPYSSIYLVSVQDADGNYYALNGENAGKNPHWVEISDGKDKAIKWINMPFGTYTVTEKEEIAGVTGYELGTTYYVVTTATTTDDETGEETTTANKEEAKNATLGTDNKTADLEIDNVYTPEKTYVKVVKKWVTSDTTTIPDTLTVYLNATAAGETTKTDITLKKDEDWTWTSEALPVYDENGQKITYTWTEGTLPSGYSLTSSIETDLTAEAEEGEEAEVIGKITTLTNTYTPGETSVQVTKVWNDADDVDGKRPDSIQVQLYVQTPAAEEGAAPNETAKGDPVTLPITDVETGEESWTYIWTGLPEMIDGVKQTYVVRELDVTKETDPETGDATGELVVSGKDDATYYVSYKQDGNNWTVTNTYTPETTEVPVNKVWDDNNDQDGVRPESITVILYADGKPIEEKVLTVKDTIPWGYVFTNLPKYTFDDSGKGGKEIEYTVKEFMDVQLNLNYVQVGEPTKNEDGWIITNKHKPETTEVSVLKVWDDKDNQDGVRPESIEVMLVRDGEAMYDENVTETAAYKQTLSADNGWTYTWTDLPVHYQKTEGEGDEATVTENYIYTVAEIDAVENEETGKVTIDFDGTEYTVTITGDEETGYTITNSYEPKTVDIDAYKYWQNFDGVEADYQTDNINKDLTTGSVTFTLESSTDGESWTAVEPGEDDTWTNPQTLTAADAEGNWMASWTNLPKYAQVDGETVEIDYRVVESAATVAGEDITPTEEADTTKIVTITEDNEGNVEFVNTLPSTEVSVTKVWENDEDVANFVRPESVDVILVQNGEALYDENDSETADYKQTLDEDNDWSYTWKELQKYDNAGMVVEYTINELEVDGYTVDITENKTEDGTFSYTVTNTLNRNMLKIYKAFSFNGTPVTLTEEQKENLEFTVTTTVGEGEDAKTYYVIYDKTATADDGNIHGKFATLTETESHFTYADFSDGMLVLENLPVGAYTITESGAAGLIEGYTWSTGTVKVGRNGTATEKDVDATELTADAEVNTEDFTQVFFENKYTKDVGPLMVVKKVEMTEGSAAIDADKIFRIAVYSQAEAAEGETEGKKTYYATNGNVVTEDNKWVEFKADDEITWLNLSAGIYFVEEDEGDAEVENYTLTVAYSNKDGIEVKVLEDGEKTPKTTVTNTYDQHKGELKVKKTVEVKPEDEEITLDSWKIAVSDSEGNYYNTEGKIVTGDEIWSEIEAGKILTFKNLPVGTYTVEEDQDAAQETGFTLTVSGEGEVEVAYVAPTAEGEGEPVTEGEGDDEDKADADIEIVNTYKKDLGNLTVTKKVIAPETDNAEALKTKAFKIAVITTTGEGSDSVTTYYKKDGTAAEGAEWITLTPNEDGTYDAVEWKDLPAGTYTVIEDTEDAEVDGLSLTVSNEGKIDVIVAADEDTDATITNTYTDEVGDLKIVKNFDFGDDDEPDAIELAGLKFIITGPNDYSQTIYYAQFETVDDVKCYVIRNLPVGEYKVVESDEDKLLASLNYTLVSAESDPENGMAEVVKDGEVTVTLTNTYEKDKGNLVIIKSFSGVDDVEEEKLAALSFTLTKPDGTTETNTYGSFKTYKLEDGKYVEDTEGTIRAWVLENVDLGTYFVTETNADGLLTSASYSFVSADSTTTGSATIAKDKTEKIELTNTYTPDLGSLTIVKGFKASRLTLMWMNWSSISPARKTTTRLSHMRTSRTACTPSTSCRWASTPLPRPMPKD